MKRNLKTILLSLSTLIALSACFHRGADSKHVKYDYYELVNDGNNGDSSFFKVYYKNESNYPLKSAWLKMTIKDTSSKMFKSTLFSDLQDLPEIPAKTNFKVVFYAKDFQFGDNVGKLKFYLSWKNHKGKTAVRRVVDYQ